MSITQLEKLRDWAASGLIERGAEVDAVLLAIVAGENVLLVGEPGTAKSMATSRIGKAIDGARFGRVLLSKHSTPEEVFGPLDPQALLAGRYERLAGGYLPDSDVAFLDEVGKASAAIANNLLTLMEERLYRHGPDWRPARTRCFVGASNEHPVGEAYQEFAALYDRFLIRRPVHRVSGANRAKLWKLNGAQHTAPPVVTIAEIEAVGHAAHLLPVSDAADAALSKIVDDLETAGIYPSDRRLSKSMKVAKAAAMIAGAAEVLPEHLECLADVLWSDPIEQPVICADIVLQVANPTGAQVAEIIKVAGKICDSVAQAGGGDVTAARIKAMSELEGTAKELKKLANGGNARAVKALAWVRESYAKMGAAQLGIPAEKAMLILGDRF